MPGIIEFPTLVQDGLAQYGDLFGNEPSGGTSPNTLQA